jgi:small subunit ribosomal protein S20
MNKKQKNRKIVTQNKRNRIINRKYISIIKTLSKRFRTLFLKLSTENSKNIEENFLKEKLFSLIKNLFSIIDKAAKKKIIHKNTAARKKSALSKMLKKLSSL